MRLIDRGGDHSVHIRLRADVTVEVWVDPNWAERLFFWFISVMINDRNTHITQIKAHIHHKYQIMV